MVWQGAASIARFACFAAAAALGLSAPSAAVSAVILHETFDKLILPYTSPQNSEPVGIERVLPLSNVEPAEREIDLRFLGGGTEMSNSLFISYAVGPGHGLSLPPVAMRPSSNTRTGYIIRLIRHGDGTNEVKFYRNDTGWIKPLQNDWTLPCNPVSRLRRVIIRHRQSGEHEILLTFDTGALLTRTYVFQDGMYPPGNAQRRFQVSAKGHASLFSSADLQIQMDGWTVSDHPAPPKMRAAEKKPAAGTRKQRKKLDDEDDLSSAYTHLSRVLELRLKQYGDTHPKVAESLRHLAHIYESKDTAEAERLYRQALVMSEESPEPRGRDVVETVIALGGFYKNRQRWSEAETLYKRSLQMLEEAKGRDQLEVADVLQALGQIAQERGRPAEADTMFHRALRIKEKILGGNHRDLMPILNYLETLHEILGASDAAESIFKRSLALRRLFLGPDHVDVAGSYYRLGVYYQLMERDVEAEEMYKRSLVIREKSLGPNHPHVGNCLYSMAFLYQKQARYPEAMSSLKRALEIFEKELGPEHPNVAQGLADLAGIHILQGQNAAAEALLERSLAIREKSGEDNLDMANTLYNLGRVYQNLGRAEESERHYRRSLIIRQDVLGQDHPDVASGLNAMGALYHQQNRPAEAEKMYQQSLDIKEKILGPIHPSVAQTLTNLAKLYHLQGRHEDAQRSYLEALRVWEKVEGQSGPDVVMVMENLSRLYGSMGRMADAEAYAQRAADLKAAVNGGR